MVDSEQGLRFLSRASQTGILLLLPLAAASCSQQPPYTLTENNGVYNDQGLGKPDRFFRRVRFKENSLYPPQSPNPALPSLEMDLCLEGTGIYKIVSSEETSGHEGFLVDAPGNGEVFSFSRRCDPKGTLDYEVRYPVIYMGKSEKFKVWVGVSENTMDGSGTQIKAVERTYKHMRAYSVQKNDQGLKIDYIGLEDLNPPLKLRDAIPTPTPLSYT